MPSSSATPEASDTARLLLVVLAFAWGLNWTATGFAVHQVSPWTLRVAGAGLGVITLLAAALIGGHSLHVPRSERVHVMVAGLFNVAGFQLLSAFATLAGGASRAVIVTYSMPIWATILSCLLLGEKLTAMRQIAFALCVAGLGTLVWPLLAHGIPVPVLLSLGCALCWTIATVYLKWVKTTVPPLANAAWQLAFGFCVLTAASVVAEGFPRFGQIPGRAWLAIAFIGIPGTGLAQFLWWAIVGRLPTITASLGSLLVPVVGVVASMIVLGERLTLNDAAGFLLIFLAAAGVLLGPGGRK